MKLNMKMWHWFVIAFVLISAVIILHAKASYSTNASASVGLVDIALNTAASA